MDFDIAWCPACDKQIAPKRYTIKVPRESPIPPPAPPPSPKRSKGKTGGLVNGTGRLRHNGTIKAPPAPPVVMKERTVIEQGPTPLYCSDECQFADLHAQRRDAPMDPAVEEPQHDSTPTSVDKFLKFYNLPPLPKVPSFAPTPVMPELPWTSGIMMAGKLIDSLCPPPQKPYVGKYRPVEEPRKPTKGWNDGSNAWRDAVYSKNSQSIFEDRHPDAFPTRTPVAFSHRSSAPSFSTSPTHPVQVPDSEKMLADFAGKFVRSTSFSPSSASSRAASSSSVSSAPASSSAASSSSAPSPRRERSLVHKAAEGMLVVPNIKLKVNSGASSSSLTGGYGSRRSVRSPLSATSMSMSSTTSSESGEEEEDDGNNTERCVSSLSKRVAARRALPESMSPSFFFSFLYLSFHPARSWSYDNMLTYDAMPVMPQMRKVKKPQLQIIDGKERIVEIEVEELHERKCLFTFAPNLLKTSSV